jgi:hypothetical protein
MEDRVGTLSRAAAQTLGERGLVPIVRDVAVDEFCELAAIGEIDTTRRARRGSSTPHQVVADDRRRPYLIIAGGRRQRAGAPRWRRPRRYVALHGHVPASRLYGQYTFDESSRGTCSAAGNAGQIGARDLVRTLRIRASRCSSTPP